MTVSLVPQDACTQRLLAKILAVMIKGDFLEARAGGTSLATGPTSADSDADQDFRRQKRPTARKAVEKIGERTQR